MNYIKTYEQFSLSDQNNLTEQYLMGDITFEHYEYSMTFLLNEGLDINGAISYLGKKVDNIKEWVLNTLSKVVLSIIPYLKKISMYINKINNIFGMILKKINNFREKHPFLFKVLVCLLVLVALSIIFAQGASAQGHIDINSDELKNGIKIDGVNIDHLNILIGYVKDTYPDSKEVLATLTDAKDGTLDGTTMENYMETVKTALNNFNYENKNIITGEKVKWTQEQLQNFKSIGQQFYEYVSTGYLHFARGDSSTYNGIVNSEILKAVELKL